MVPHFLNRGGNSCVIGCDRTSFLDVKSISNFSKVSYGVYFFLNYLLLIYVKEKDTGVEA